MEAIKARHAPYPREYSEYPCEYSEHPRECSEHLNRGTQPQPQPLPWPHDGPTAARGSAVRRAVRRCAVGVRRGPRRAAARTHGAVRFAQVHPFFAGLDWDRVERRECEVRRLGRSLHIRSGRGLSGRGLSGSAEVGVRGPSGRSVYIRPCDSRDGLSGPSEGFSIPAAHNGRRSVASRCSGCNARLQHRIMRLMHSPF